jgi:hypothetical protein
MASYTFSQVSTGLSSIVRDLKTHNGIVYAVSTSAPCIAGYNLSGTRVYQNTNSLLVGSRCIAITDSYKYTGTGTESTIHQIDNSGGVVTTTIDQPFTVTSMAISNTNRLYLASIYDNRVFYINISGPLSLNSVATLAYTFPTVQSGIYTYIQSLLIVGSTMYIAVFGTTDNRGLYSVNIDSSNNPIKFIDISNNQFELNALAVGPPNNSKLYSLQEKPGGITKLYESSGNTFNEITNYIDIVPIDTMTNLTFNSDFMYTTNSNRLFKSNPAFCFNKGTKILCLNTELVDEYLTVENLQEGDFVKTFKHGYRKIIKTIAGKLYNNPKQWNMCMYKMTKTDSNGLLEDLIVTGGHSILVDSITEEQQAKYDEMGISDFSKVTIDGKRLLLSCVSEQFAPMPDNEMYTYYHLLLENNDDDEERFGIWANGILTETPNEKALK